MNGYMEMGPIQTDRNETFCNVRISIAQIIVGFGVEFPSLGPGAPTLIVTYDSK